MNNQRIWMVLTMSVLGTMSCHKNGEGGKTPDGSDGPMEEAGEWTDEAAESAGEAVEDAAESAEEAVDDDDSK